MQGMAADDLFISCGLCMAIPQCPDVAQLMLLTHRVHPAGEELGTFATSVLVAGLMVRHERGRQVPCHVLDTDCACGGPALPGAYLKSLHHSSLHAASTVTMTQAMKPRQLRPWSCLTDTRWSDLDMVPRSTTTISRRWGWKSVMACSRARHDMTTLSRSALPTTGRRVRYEWLCVRPRSAQSVTSAELEGQALSRYRVGLAALLVTCGVWLKAW